MVRARAGAISQMWKLRLNDLDHVGGCGNVQCVEMADALARDSWREGDIEGAGPPPPPQGWPLGVLGCSPGPVGPGPAPGTKMETSPPAKSMSWPASAGLPQPPTLPLGAVTAQGGQGASPGGQGWRSGLGQWLKVLESSSPRFEPLPHCVTLSHILTSRSLGFTTAKQAQSGLGRGGVAWSYLGAAIPGGREGAELIAVQMPREGGSVWVPAAPALVSPLPRLCLWSQQAQVSHRSRVPAGVPCSWLSLVSHTSVPWRDHSPDPWSCMFSAGGSSLSSTHPASQKPQRGTRKV